MFIEDGNIGHRPGVKGGYFPVPPVDSLHDIRSAMCLALEEMGCPTLKCTTTKWPLPASAKSVPCSTPWSSKRRRNADPEIRGAQRRPQLRQDRDLHAQADRWRQRYRHARSPVIWQRRQEPVRRQRYAGLSDIALFYIGGIIKHAKALNAITNAVDQLLQASGSGFRSAGHAGLLGRVTVRLRFVFRYVANRKAVVSKSVSRIQSPTRTCASLR